MNKESALEVLKAHNEWRYDASDITAYSIRQIGEAIEVALMEIMLDMHIKQEVKKCLDAIGNAYRHDWSNMDGRSLEYEMSLITIVVDGEINYEQFCEIAGIDSKTRKWTE